MSWKFWKKDEMTMPDLGSSFSTNPFGSGSLGAAGSSLGSGARNDLGLGSSGLDLSDHFQPSGNASAFGGLPPPGASQFGSQQQSFSAQNSFSPPPAIVPPSMQEPPGEHGGSVSKDLEVIAAKLDTIRAQLEMLNTRIGNLERAQNQQPGTYPKRPWY